MRSGHRALIAAWYVAATIVGAWSIFFLPVHRTSEIGQHTRLIREFGSGVPVGQTFHESVEGLYAIRVQISAAAPADVLLQYSVSVDKGGVVTRINAGREIENLEGTQWISLDFPAIAASAGSSCSLELQVERVAAHGGGRAPAVSLVAASDWPAGPGVLTVAYEQRAGALKFEARALADSLFGRLRLTRMRQGGSAPAIAALMAYSLMLLPFGVVMLRPATAPALTAPDGLRAQAPRDSPVRAALICALLVSMLGGLWWTAKSRGTAIVLTDQLYAVDVEALQPLFQFVHLLAPEINGPPEQALSADPPARLTWHLTVPRPAALTTAVALLPDAWDKSADGVVFRILVNADGQTTELFMRHVDPRHVPADRAWIPVALDLTRFAGRTVGLMFVTEPSMPGQPPDGDYDWAVWAAPRIGS